MTPNVRAVSTARWIDPPDPESARAGVAMPINEAMAIADRTVRMADLRCFVEPRKPNALPVQWFPRTVQCMNLPRRRHAADTRTPGLRRNGRGCGRRAKLDWRGPRQFSFTPVCSMMVL